MHGGVGTQKILTEDQYLLIETLYGVDKPANFENKWIFYAMILGVLLSIACS